MRVGPRTLRRVLHRLAEHPRRLQIPPAEHAARRLRVYHAAKRDAFVVGTKLHVWKLARTVRSACTLFQLRQIGFSESFFWCPSLRFCLCVSLGTTPCYTASHLPAMTKQEKQRLAAVLRATEYLFLENIALKLVLEHREVSNWQRLLGHLLADKEMLAGVRLKFKDLFAEIEGSKDPSGALEAFLGELPRRGKPH